MRSILSALAALLAVAGALMLDTPARAQPDLMTFTFPITSPVVASSSFYVTGVVANIGDAPAQNYSYVAFLLSTNSGRDYYDDWPAPEYWMEQKLAAGEWRTNIYHIHVPPLLAGTYYLSALADGGVDEEEANEFNNLSSAQPIQVVRAVDMALTELQSAPIWTNGETAPIRCAITNRSAFAPWDYFSVGFYLSTDPVITTNDLRVYSADLYCGPSASLAFRDTMDLPQNIPPGTYYFGAIVDDTDNLAEADETNNTIVGHQVEVWAPVDLKLISCTGPSSAVGGRPISVTSLVTNATGSGYADFRLGFYLSSDPFITTHDLMIGSNYYYHTVWNDMAATDQTTCTVPTTLAPGTYYLGAIADFEGHVAESNEVNNTLPGTPIEITVEVDIGMMAFTPGPAVSAGGNLLLSTTITNIGALAQTEPFQIGYFASTNPAVTTNDLFLGEWSAWASAPWGIWAAIQNGFVVTLGTNVPPGTYYVGAFADWRNRFAERVETNNILISGPVQVRIGLDVAALAVSTESVGAPGGLLLVTNIFANTGLDTLPSFSRRLYLSADTNITPADWRIDDYGLYGGLSVGQRITNALHHRIPKNIPPGTYYIGFLTDGENRLPELDESNNAAVGNLVEVRDAYHITVTEVQVTGTNVMVSFPTAPGRYYALERTASLAPPVFWTTVAGAGDIRGTGDTMQVPDPAGLRTGQRFYRAHLLP